MTCLDRTKMKLFKVLVAEGESIDAAYLPSVSQ